MSNLGKIEEKVRDFRELGVKVFFVVFGDELNLDEFLEIVFYKEYLVKMKEDEDFEIVVEKIMDKVFVGKFYDWV